MKKKIAFIAKTNINTDGRILNQLQILEKRFKNFKIDFILLEDKPTKIDLGKNVIIHPIKTTFRNNNIYRFLTVLEFSLKSFIKLVKIRPEIIHAQDSAVVLPVLVYKTLKVNKVKIIYDDHELPNQDLNLQQKVFAFLEKKLLKKSDKVIFANEERLFYLHKKYNLKKRKLFYFINLPYFETSYRLSYVESLKYKKLIKEKRNGINLILHQGSIKKQRGRDLLALVSEKIEKKTKIVLIGITEGEYKSFIREYKLNASKFHFIGYVNYHALDKFWNLADATIIMYLPDLINNRFCAPNRFYIALKHKVPIYVNKNNPVLFNLINKYNCGGYIEDIIYEKQYFHPFKTNLNSKYYEELLENEINKFCEIYEQIKL